MHPAPLVDPQTLELLRRRLIWGILQLEQPATDLHVSLQHFTFRWTQSQPPPALREWQKQLLQIWRRRPRACQAIALEPVLEVLVQSLRLEDDSSLDGWFTPTLFGLARHQVGTDELKPVLRFSWQQLSQGVARLRQGMGPFSSEGEQALRAVLACLQQIQYYFQSPEVGYLEEAGRRWNIALEEWNQVANLCLTGLQPATGTIYWGKLLEALEPEEDIRAEVEDSLTRWFEEWSADLVHSLGPYLAQILGAEPALESLARALLRWQALTPDWQAEVAQAWSGFLQALPPGPESSEVVPYFRWLEPDLAIEESFVRRNPWRAWLRQASQIPPRGPAAEEARRLKARLELSRLLAQLVRPSFLRHQVEFPERVWLEEAADWLGAWLEGYDPLSQAASTRVDRRLTELERVLLRDFPVPERNTAPSKA